MPKLKWNNIELKTRKTNTPNALWVLNSGEIPDKGDLMLTDEEHCAWIRIAEANIVITELESKPNMVAWLFVMV